MKLIRAKVAGSLGILALGVWLILTGLIALFDVSLPGAPAIMAVLAIVAGALILWGR